MTRSMILALAASATWSLASAPSARAQFPCEAAANSVASAPAGHLRVVPDGSGPSLAELGLTVELWVYGCPDEPIEGFPRVDLWLDDAGTGDISLCQAGSIADADTDAQGYTTFSGAIAGGGHDQAGLQVYLSGVALWASPTLPITVNSPDMNGDLRVDILDLSAFAEDFNSPSYSFRSDLVHDGQVDLKDVGRFAAANGVSCP